MPAYVVAYDLNKETKRPKIVDEVKEFSWARLSESSYAISTNLTAQQVYARFEKHIDSNDRLYVIPLKKPFAGFGPEAVNDWLDKHVPW